MPSDGEILRRSVADPGAFEEIFSRHFDAVLSHARRRVGWAAGEEIASQTFLVAFERRSAFDPRFSSAKPWLLGIATNLIRHHLRDERIHLAGVARVPVEASAHPIDDPERMDAERARPLLARALMALSVTDRETFLLVALAEFTYEQAADALGVPVGTVRSRIHRARAALRERLPGLEATPKGEDAPGEGEPWTSSS